ncbi:MAG: hypothetical protein EOO41_00745 [Methanobacteriota archaeon]|nr:MAG: hypothetical protein EOO41_00745 [Euryarchaeota archaeon]
MPAVDTEEAPDSVPLLEEAARPPGVGRASTRAATAAAADATAAAAAATAAAMARASALELELGVLPPREPPWYGERETVGDEAGPWVGELLG